MYFQAFGTFLGFIGNLFLKGEPLLQKSGESQELCTIWKNAYIPKNEFSQALCQEAQNAIDILQNLCYTITQEEKLAFFKEYNRLFFVPSQEIILWESVYTSPKRELFSKALYAVQDFYNDAGFVLQSNTNECEDHIAIELCFVSNLMLCEQNQTTQFLLYRFLKEHLGKWGIPSCLSLYENTTNPLWQALCMSLHYALKYIFIYESIAFRTKE